MENQFRIQHYCALGLVILAMFAASIQPLEFESYLLHQAGTVFMLAALLIAFKKVGLSFSSFVLYLIFFSVHDKFHRTLILSGFCFLKIAKISLNSSFFPKPIKC